MINRLSYSPLNDSWTTRPRIFGVLLSLVFCGFTVSRVLSQTVTFNDFSSTTGLTINGASQVVNTSDGDVLRLTPATDFQSGSVFSTTAINAADFSTFYSFRITEPSMTTFDGNVDSGADGIVFVVQSVSNSIGGDGGGIGYGGIPDSVGIEFDTWINSINNDPTGNHIGIVTQGIVDHGFGAPFTVDVPSDFEDGERRFVWIDYDGANLEVRLSTTSNRPTLPIITRIIDIPSELGNATDAFVGFTSGTGGAWANHDLINWTYRSEFDPIIIPEPNSMALLVVGILGIGFRIRR